MSKIFKSDYVQVGTPKSVKHTFPVIKKHIEENSKEDVSTQCENLIRESETIANNLIEDAKQLYLKIIEEANEEAKKIVDSAYQDGEKLKHTEAQRGYSEGFENGHKEAKAAAQAIIDEAAEIRSFLDQRKESLYNEVEEQVIDLVLDISKKIIGDELTQNKDAIFLLIKQSLDRCAFKNKLIIRVSSNDYEYVCQNKEKIGKLVEGISDFEVYLDLSLGQGGCVIETSSGEVNASIETQLKELEKAFLFMLRNE